LKLVQKVKLLPVFESIDQQNLTNFEQREGHQFKFQKLRD
jgi:hypothetical protein